MIRFLLLVGLIACLSEEVLSALSCKNEEGKDVDWYVLLKPPSRKELKNPGLSAGLGYGFVESANPTSSWKLGKFDLNNTRSFTGATFKEVFDKPDQYSYVQYNDGKPEGFGSDSSTYAHAKGALVWNNENAVWIVHSVPKFLPAFHLKHYEYPGTGTGNGQNFLCVTVDAKKYVEKILLHIATMKAQVYATHIANNLNKEVAGKVAPIINILAQKDTKNANKYEPENNSDKVDEKRIGQLTTQLETKNSHTPFTAIVKSRKDNVDLWSSIVAGAMKAKEFVVRTWTMAQPKKNLLGATCNIKKQNDVIDVLNVWDMTMKFENHDETVQWDKKDHSKWGICTDGGEKCYCAGDMNRATSQFKRGGGVVCMHNPQVNEAWSKTITNQVSCKQKVVKKEEKKK